MFSETFVTFAHDTWASTKSTLGELACQLQAQLDETTGDTKILLELALGTLPASDLASVPFSILKSYAEHAQQLRATSPYCRDIPEDIFLHDVFYPRINSEELVDCRPFFYEKLCPAVEQKSAEQAALAVNRWCAAQMTYETTDMRTIDPLTAYSCGLGRCGEESTFLVTALRSVGLPARQVYVPWWSHCDDNHAWVEVYTGDGWHFLGACEPEPILDRGWFVNASSRAMVVVVRRFFSYVGEGLRDEKLVQKNGICLAYNQIRRYAKSAEITVRVQDAQGNPVEGAWVRFFVENMAQAGCIAELETDALGQVQLETGLGSCLIEAKWQNRFAWKTIRVDEAVTVVLLTDQDAPAEGTVDWDFCAPETGNKHRAILTPEMEQQKAQTLREAKQLRIQRIEGYWKPEYQTGDPEFDRVFHLAGGHAQALWAFYQQYGDAARDMLLHLSMKDWRDADPAVLAAHLNATRDFAGEKDETFLSYVQCPRIGYEKLTDWRAAVQQYLTAEQKEAFRKAPDTLWPWIEANFQPQACRWLPVLWLQPGAALRLGAADLRGRRLLFVAILRTLGIPARLDPVDGRAQYGRAGRFYAVEAAAPQEPTAAISVRIDPAMTYGQSWGLSRWNQGWQPLDFEGEDTTVLDLPLGLYRLHTVNRLPNGNQLIHFKTFPVRQAETLTVEKRAASAEQLLAHYPVVLPVAAHGLEWQLYLECGAEPTEHVLNELLAAKTLVQKQMEHGLRLRLLLPGAEARQDPTLQKVLACLPQAVVEETDFTDSRLETLARALYLEPGLWPLMTVTDGSISYYAHAGYAVGSVALALELAERKLAQTKKENGADETNPNYGI